LNSDVNTLELVLLEHPLNHHFSVFVGIEGWFGEEDFAFFGFDLEALEESVIPNVIDVGPIDDLTVYKGVANF